jgi:hypothetical protein
MVSTLNKYWRKMDSPDRVGTCEKLRQGQLLMARYQFVHVLGNDEQVDRVKERSIELARRMVKHAEECETCTLEKVLEEPFFYGVYSK